MPGKATKTRISRVLLAGWVLLTAGCAPDLDSLAARLTPSPTFARSTETSTVTETPTENPVTCVYVWSNRSLPDVSTEINQAFRRLGLVEVEAEAFAYGEDCLDSETNRVVRFLAMQTDVSFTVAVERIDDPQFLGEWVERITMVMDDFEPGTIPGSNPGYFGITFLSGSETLDLWFSRTRVNNLLKEGVRGADLLEALQLSQ